ncbi:hypothetical protein NSK_002271 [Nannochloropsis salina CCMP1776]|uniref:TMS membrane protein/tumor differentially expressed protein n=1 Tax=Nannochloropsis salina CCMP1776 TaxID=1027361 RepID=A0A4D9D8B4_9STRA|nr:hypothetical protein NSK_002271 [Nannochloropsis salina CCMP1776]|eukprot:TFJ86617.1 hypothetical protein NSK_002271 [Nannochloropsis salina CCMP1776]
MGIVFSMGTSAASALASCCVGSAASCVCAGLKQCLPSGYSAAKVYALLLFFASVVAALILRTTEPAINADYFTVRCTGEFKDRCYGFQAVYRLSFVDFFFFLALALGSKFVVGVHTHAWGLKYLVFLGFLIGMFFVDNKVFAGYVHLARVASLVYLVAQVVTLINFSYNMHTTLMGKVDAAESSGETNGAKFYKVIYLCLSLFCLAGGLTGIGLLYAFYAHCRLSQFWITLTLLVSLACLFSSLLDRIGMGLLTPSVLFLYFDYQCWSAILSNPDPACNKTASLASSKAKSWNTAVALVFLAVSLTYTGWSTYRSIVGTELQPEQVAAAAAGGSGAGAGGENLTKILTGEGGTTTTATPVIVAEEGDEEKGGAAVPTLTAADQAEASLIWIFHLLLALGGAYMAMAITNWGNANGIPDGVGDGDSTVGRESMWLKIVSQWITMLLYAWSLWAPVCRGEGEEY